MPIVFRCQQCRQKLSITSRKAGEQVRCPSCAAQVRVPTLAEIAARQPPPEAGPPRAGAVSAARRELGADPAGAALSGAAGSAVAKTSRSPAEQIEPPSAAETAGLDQVPRELAAAQRGEFVPRPLPPSPEDEDDEFVMRKAESEFEEMDLTPMVDVTFLLLIFFMITASFSLQKTLRIPPPDPDEKGAAQAVSLEDLQEDSVIVEIDENNTIIVDDQPLADPEALVPTLEEKMRSDNKAELVLEAADAALHEFVVKVVDAANAVGMQKIRIATRAAE